MNLFIRHLGRKTNVPRNNNIRKLTINKQKVLTITEKNILKQRHGNLFIIANQQCKISKKRRKKYSVLLSFYGF